MSTSVDKFIKADFHLPDHKDELLKAESLIDKIKIKFEQHQKFKNLTGKSHTSLYEEIVRVLDYVGNLSTVVFQIEEELEAMYILQFKHAPQMAKKLWLDHYDFLHRPYTLLKNRCYRLLEDLDNEYLSLYKSTPPNWNI
jgi:hypothetical protein